MNCVKKKKKSLVRTKRHFWDDPEIGEKLDNLPDGEMSYEIRVALRKHFGITPGVNRQSERSRL